MYSARASPRAKRPVHGADQRYIRDWGPGRRKSNLFLPPLGGFLRTASGY